MSLLFKIHCKDGTVQGYINQYHDRTGYWISLVSVSLGSCLLSLLDIEDGDAVIHTLIQEDQGIPAKQLQWFTFDTTHTMSMSCILRVDNFQVRGDYQGDYQGDVNGNLKYRKDNIGCIRRLSQSDPDILISLRINQTLDKSPPVSISYKYPAQRFHLSVVHHR